MRDDQRRKMDVIDEIDDEVDDLEVGLSIVVDADARDLIEEADVTTLVRDEVLEREALDMVVAKLVVEVEVIELMLGLRVIVVCDISQTVEVDDDVPEVRLIVEVEREAQDKVIDTLQLVFEVDEVEVDGDELGIDETDDEVRLS